MPHSQRPPLNGSQQTHLAGHVDLEIFAGLSVRLCDPHCPWQRGTNESTNRLLRQCFPKGTNRSKHSLDDLEAVAVALNGRPPPTLGWRMTTAISAVRRK